MDSFTDKETQLQQQLKKVCNKKGRELNLTRSSEIFNKLGLLYKTKSPDKISLIQSAALLNAAIIRQPDNQKFQDDLYDLCLHVLNCANAEQNVANLVEVAKHVKSQIEEMRENARIRLGALEKIPENLGTDKQVQMEHAYILQVKSLLLSLSSDYKRIMALISRKCIQMMGTPPCKYALVGLGSLARNEITPYSDFEHILLLQNLLQQPSSNDISDIKEYFRWYSVLFHFIVINLQESIVPNVSIRCLNDTLTPGGDWFWDSYTPQGISFDSLKPLASKVPLGRTQKTPNKPWTTELIKPVDEMVKYLEVDEDLKNGYKLGDMLTSTCFIEGDELVYDGFCQKRKETLKENPTNISNIKATLEEDLENLDVGVNFYLFRTSSNINIKRVIYRSITLFMSALGRLHDVDVKSSFEIIDEFHLRHVINDHSAQRLSHSVAVACHMRLFHYMSRNKQDDTIHKDTTVAYDGKDKLEELTKSVSKRCLIKCLATAFILQDMLRRNSGISKFNEFLNALDFTAHMRYFTYFVMFQEGALYGDLYLAKQTTLKEDDYDGYHHLSYMYANIKQFDKSFALNSQIKEQISVESKFDNLRAALSLDDARCWIGLQKWEETLHETDGLLRTNLHPDLRFSCLFYNGICKMMLGRYHGALSAYRDLEKVSHSKLWDNAEFLAAKMFGMSQCLIGALRVRQGVHMAREGLNLAAENDLSDVIKQFSSFLAEYSPLLVYV